MARRGSAWYSARKVRVPAEGLGQRCDEGVVRMCRRRRARTGARKVGRHEQRVRGELGLDGLYPPARARFGREMRCGIAAPEVHEARPEVLHNTHGYIRCSGRLGH